MYQKTCKHHWYCRRWSIGTADHPELKEMSATIKEVSTRWDTTTRAELLADADDGIKGLAAFLRKENGEAHAFYLDKQLLASVNTSDDEQLHKMTLTTTLNLLIR